MRVLMGWGPRQPDDPNEAASLLLGNHVADAADGVDHDPGAVFGELFAQPGRHYDRGACMQLP